MIWGLGLRGVNSYIRSIIVVIMGDTRSLDYVAYVGSNSIWSGYLGYRYGRIIGIMGVGFRVFWPP